MCPSYVLPGGTHEMWGRRNQAAAFLFELATYVSILGLNIHDGAKSPKLSSAASRQDPSGRGTLGAPLVHRSVQASAVSGASIVTADPKPPKGQPVKQ